MARHRTLRTRVRRGIARWPVAVVGLVVLVVLGWLSWTWAGGVLDRRTAAQAGDCSEGEAVLRVAVTPSIGDAVRDVAQRWSGTRPVVYDHCIRVEVQAVDSELVLEGLTQDWNTADLGERVQAWLPDSTLWANRLAAQNHALIGAAPESVATSPVLLALPEAASQALMSGSSFRWTDLPDVTSDSAGWARYGKPEWGPFTVAMPDPTTSTATAMAIQSALAGASPDGRGPVTTDVLALQPVKDTLARLASTKPANAPESTWEALDRMSGAPGVNAAGFSAVPVFEVDLYRHNVGADGGAAPAQPLHGVAAGGPTPVADFPFVPLAGDDVSEAQARAAQSFREFLTASDQQTVLAEAGLRVESTSVRPSPAPGIRWAATTEHLVAADATTTQQISAAWATASDGGQVVTVLVDVSGSMEEDGGDGRTRIDWLRAALSGQVERSVSGSLGLWEFSRALDGDVPYRRLVPTKPVAEQRQALLDGIARLEPRSATQLYTSLVAVYEAAQRDFQQGKQNRIVVITDGPNDGGLNFQQLTSRMDQLQVGANPVPISIVAIGSEPERLPLSEIAERTGGTLSVVDDASGLDPALAELLSTAPAR
jgi:Mg-chelatase subunit ChlD